MNYIEEVANYETLKNASDQLFGMIKEVTGKNGEDTYVFGYVSLLKKYLEQLKTRNIDDCSLLDTTIDLYNMLVKRLAKYESLKGREVSLLKLDEILGAMLNYKGVKITSKDTIDLLKLVSQNYKEYNYYYPDEFYYEETLTVKDIIGVITNKQVKRSNDKVVFISSEEEAMIIDDFIDYIKDYEYYGTKEVKEEIKEKYEKLFKEMIGLGNISFEPDDFDFTSWFLAKCFPSLESKLKTFIDIYNDFQISDLEKINSVYSFLKDNYKDLLVNNVFSSLEEAIEGYNEYQTEQFNLQIKTSFLDIVDDIVMMPEIKIKAIMAKYDLSYKNTLKLINILEKEKVISDTKGSRKVIISKEVWEEKRNNIEAIPLKDEFLYLGNCISND